MTVMAGRRQAGDKSTGGRQEAVTVMAGRRQAGDKPSRGRQAISHTEAVRAQGIQVFEGL